MSQPDEKQTQQHAAAPPAAPAQKTEAPKANEPAKVAAAKQPPQVENPFLLREIFPNVEQIISYAPPRISTLMADCVFVVDTNVLMAPFKFGGKGLDEIARLYNELSNNKRLFVAEWSLREFAKHRSDDLVVAYQTLTGRVSKANSIEGLKCPMLEGTEEYEPIQGVIREINVAIEKYKDLLGQLKGRVRDWSWNDRVSELYRKVFTTESIVGCPLSDEDILSDVNRRNKYSIPPGYHDKAKDSNNVGDLIIWHSMIGLAQKTKTNVVFISNDEKHDWVHKSEKHVIIARTELYFEFFAATGKHFGFVNWLGFLEQLAQDKEVVRQAERIGLDMSHNYKSIQQRIHAILNTLATIVREFLAGDHKGREYVFIDDSRFDSLVHDFYSARPQYDELIHSPVGSRSLAEIEIILEETETLNSQLGFMQARMKQDGSSEEAQLVVMCKRFLTEYDRYSMWFLSGSP